MSPKFLRLIIFTFSFVTASCTVGPLWSQETPGLQRLPGHSDSSFANAANRWQLTATDPRSQLDTVSPEVRGERNAYWKGPLEAARGSSGAYGAYLPGTPPEFTFEPGDIWVIATFEGFHVFEINSDDQLIYTEMNFRVEHVFRQPEGSSLSSGSLIDAGMPGGRIKSPNGEIISSQIQPSQYSVQLGHKYLMQFFSCIAGRLF